MGIAQLTRAATSSEFLAKARALLLAKPAAPVRAIFAAVVVLSNDEGLVPDMEIHESLSLLLTVGTPRIDDNVLQVQAGARLITYERGIPTGERSEVDGTAYDFATPRPIGATQLDTAFAELARDEHGHAAVPAAGTRQRLV